VRVYIAGPMSGIPEFNFPAFRAAAIDLRAQGYDVVNPAELDENDVLPDGTAAHPWSFYLRRDLQALLDCDAIYLLPGWQDSRGASLEAHVAEVLGMHITEILP
jgi:hypothetical protein